MATYFISAFSSISIEIIALIFGGVIIGMIFGAIPGLSTTMAIALCLPLTFRMGLEMGTALLIGLYIGGFSGGLIAAILMNIPGTAASIATCFDGYPMAQQGNAGKALGLGIVFSFLGGTFSFLALMLISPILANLAIKFGSFEYFALCFFALTMIITMSSDNILKGLVSGLIGILFSMIGGAPIDGLPRFTFGLHSLDGGFDLVAVLVGVFAVSELFLLAGTKEKMGGSSVSDCKIKGFGFSWKELFQEKLNFVRSSVIGVLIGILPGIGGSLASLMSYNAAKKSSKHPENFGKGINAGIVASETANNAAIGGALIPLLSLGIPGDAVTALLLGALTMQGVQPGPLLFKNSPQIVYFIFIALFIANFFMLVSEFFAIRGFVRLLKIRKAYLFPIITLLCILGAYGLNNRIFDVVTILIFGIFGYLMKQWGLQTQPFILGYIVGPMAELHFRRGLMYSEGSLIPFVSSPIALFFLIFAVASIILTIVESRRKKKA